MSPATTFDPFAPTVPTPGQSVELIAPGGYLGALVGLIDLGTHDSDYQGESKKPQRQLYLLWELEEEKADGTRHVVGVQYTNSLDKKANLAQMIEKTQGITLTPGESFPFRTLLGKSFDILIENKKNGQYTNHRVKDVNPLHRRDTPIAAADQRPHLVLSVAQGVDAVRAMDLAWVPYIYGQSVLDKMRECHEWRSAGSPAPAAGAEPAKSKRADPAEIDAIERIAAGVIELAGGHPSRDAAIGEIGRIVRDAGIKVNQFGPIATKLFDENIPF